MDSKNFDLITKTQIDFIQDIYTLAHQEKLFRVAKDIISINNALSSITAEGKESVLELLYHPDDLMSEYATDIIFFAQNARRYSNKIKIFLGKNGIDWKILK